MSTDFAILVPARLESTRFPQKLLRDATGQTLIEHSLQNLQPLRSRAQIWLVTDDETIAQKGSPFVDEVHISTQPFQSGTERIAEVLPKVDSPWILNIQADEPEIDTNELEKFMEIMLKKDSTHDMGTLATPLLTHEDWLNPNVVKVLLNQRGSALTFSRSALPYGGQHTTPNVYHHLGVYAYHRHLLQRWKDLTPGYFERCEKLEQLRALEHGTSIAVHIVPVAHKGIDTENDYQAFVQRVGLTDHAIPE